MRSFTKLTGACALAAALFVVGCDDDDDGGDGSDSGSPGGGSDSGSPGGGGDAGSPGGGGDGGAGGGDAGGGDGGGSDECDLGWEGKDVETIPKPTGTMTLTSDKVWQIEGITYVEDGDTLTIEPCTRIEGLPAVGLQPSVLVVSRGGKLMAEGTADEPILFTSSLVRDQEHAPGLWGGVVLLGRAPNNSGADVLIEGLANEPQNKYGGTMPSDNSGVLTYVRIEDPGYELTTDVEINGLTMGSVGSGTTIHHVMVVNSQDDCFEWFGGRVSADHLIADACGDDMFDTDLGYQGTLHTLLGRQRADALSSSNPNGWECDNNPTGEGPTPNTQLTANKVTLCGTGATASATAYGAVLRQGVRGELADNVIVGFDDGVSIRNPFGTPAEPYVTLSDASFFGNFRNNIGVPHSSNETFDPDDWFNMGSGNSEPDPAPFSVEDCQEADGPNSEVTGSGIGAFKDDADWAQGLWVEWTTID